MKFLFKVLSLSLFALFLPITIYSVVANFIKKDTAAFASKYDFMASADVPAPPGGGEGEGTGCEGASSEGTGCEGGGGEGGK